MTNPHFYETHLNWKSDRRGMMSSPALNQQFEVATPPEFPHGIEGIWSPEHLLVAAVESCLMTTFLAIADASKLEFLSYESSAKGKLVNEEGRFFISEITITPQVMITKEQDRPRAERIIFKAEQHCLISNSIKAEVIIKPEIILKEALAV